MKALLRGVVVVFLCARLAPVFGHDMAEEMVEAAKNFLAALPEEQRSKAIFEFKDDERLNWHFIPRARKGLPMKEMTGEQRALAHGLLNSGMSHRGYFKAVTVMSLEQILRDLEKGRGPARDPEMYFFSIFGKPGEKVWAWRVEGHHLALNFTIANGHVSASPNFLGANPGEVREGPRKGLRVLAHEEDLARALVKSLTVEQQKVAIYTNTAPSDIITGADRKARVLEPKGIVASKLNPEQQEVLLALLQEYIFRARSEFAEEEYAEIEKSPGQLYFAWAGPTEPGKGHYYRVQGPGFLLEYDNTQNNANHIHAVWRDLKNDFGEDLLRQHYDQSHQK